MIKLITAILLPTITLFASPYDSVEELKSFVTDHQQCWEGWCTDLKAQAMIDLILQERPQTCVEIGVFGGSSIFPTAATLKYNQEGTVYAIDPWDKEECLKNMDPQGEDYQWWSEIDLQRFYADFLENLQMFSLGDHCVTLKHTSFVAFEKVPDQIDILHIDGNHSEESSLSDTALYLMKVRPGGYIWFDDVNWIDNEGQNTTKRAYDYLLKKCTLIETYEVGVHNCALFQKN